MTYEELVAAVNTILEDKKKAFQQLNEVTPQAKTELQDLRILANFIKHEARATQHLINIINEMK